MLTDQQKEALDFLKNYMRKHDGVAPSFQEIGDALGVKARSGSIFRLMVSLEDQGKIKRRARRHRAIEITDWEVTPKEAELVAWLRERPEVRLRILRSDEERPGV
jgi:SOS-response transcriptional repressor LexA